jgi:hypothetical protein
VRGRWRREEQEGDGEASEGEMEKRKRERERKERRETRKGKRESARELVNEEKVHACTSLPLSFGMSVCARESHDLGLKLLCLSLSLCLSLARSFSLYVNVCKPEN